MEIIDNQPYSEPQRYQRAKKKVAAIRGFYYNLMCYCIVIPILITINLVFVPDFWWFFFPMIGWGTGLAFHAMEVYDYNPFLGKNWTERKMKELMEKEQQNNKFE
ncbi:MAG TPA: 2TM domain-containing protein [Flavobacterium sp.]|jgi:hypothetical protein